MSQYPEIYNSKKWLSMRKHQLMVYPLCKFCLDHGDPVAATVVNHIKPHRGDLELAFDPSNLESVCKPCHDVHCDAQDKGKVMAGCASDGMPSDPNHAWSE